MSILRIVIGVIAILAGLLWIAISYLGAGMADRPINPVKELYIPMALGLIPIAFGIWLIFWR